jgi:hypothetical protein
MTKKFCVAAALLCLLAFAIPIEYKYDKPFRYFSLTLIPQGLEISSAYGKKIYFYLSDLASLILLFLALFWFRIPLKRFFGNALWIVFFCAAASIAASPFAHYPIPYIRLLQLLTPFVLFSFLATAFSGEERVKLTRVILLAIVAAGTVQAGIAIAQYFHQAPLGLRCFGEETQPNSFPIQDGSRWLIDKLFHRTATTQRVMRASGTCGHANVFGGFMVLSLLATYASIMQLKQKRWILGLTLPFQFFALGISYSRSALFAWILSTLIWFGLILYKQGIKDRNLRYCAILIALSFAAIATVLFNQYSHRGGVVNYNALAKDSDSTRHFHQKMALQIMKDRPFLGLGFSQFSERAVSYFPENTSSYARATGPHNMFLFLACETGLISLFALLSAIALLLYRAIRTPITVETATFTAILIGFIFIGCCDFYLILFQQGKLMFFLVMGLLAAHCKPIETMVKQSAT